ncbi:WD40 repeat domain-containing protein [Dactylosporangium sucinum]|uniref:WD40 repeat domain-containing protein n=1 Tax=Dactylosporangium sucinum TaxID=1424081 RepID=UPI0027E52051|nr:WD40 repeat domain-containing protein [Dactylosporangium sucinum]
MAPLVDDTVECCLDLLSRCGIGTADITAAHATRAPDDGVPPALLDEGLQPLCWELPGDGVATLLRWLVEEGKPFAAGDRLALLRTPGGALVRLSAPGRAGVLARTHAEPGERVRSLDWLATVGLAAVPRPAPAWDGATVTDRYTLSTPSEDTVRVGWSPDGRHLATSSNQSPVRIWDAATGRQARTVGGDRASLTLAWSPDGERFATSGTGPKVTVRSGGGEWLYDLEGHDGRVYATAWSPDGRFLATAGYDDTARVWDAAGGRELRVLHGHRTMVSSVAWSPDGTRLLTASYDNTARIWDPATGAHVDTLTGHDSAVSQAVWSPDGSRVATSSHDKTVRIWGASHQPEVLDGHGFGLYTLAWSPDGRHIAAGGIGGTSVWDAERGTHLGRIDGPQRVQSLAWSPDGQWLATAGDDHVRVRRLGP